MLMAFYHDMNSFMLLEEVTFYSTLLNVKVFIPNKSRQNHNEGSLLSSPPNIKSQRVTWIMLAFFHVARPYI
jgi:hypothetical protein